MNPLQTMLSDPQGIAIAYRLFGRQQLRNALVGVFGSRARLAPIAASNKDQLEELVAKRDAAIEALMDYAEELANLDND